MKNLFNLFGNIFSTFVGILSFGLIKLNKNVRKEFRVELLKVKMNDCELNLKKNYDKLLGIVQEKAVHEKKINKIESELVKLNSSLRDAREIKDNEKFSELALQYKTKSSMLDESKKVVEAYNQANDIIEKNIKVLKQELVKLNYEITVIEAKQKTYESIKGVNEIMSDIHMPNGTDNTSNISEIKEQLDDDLVRETAKAEILKQEVPTLDISEFNTEEDMDKFLSEIE